MQRALLLFVAVAFIPRAAAAQGDPLGPEFRVNTYTSSSQSYPSIASDSAGNFVVVWTSGQDGSNSGVFGQRFASSGGPLGPEFRVNTYTTSLQSDPAIASDASGNFVVVWTSDQDGSNLSVYGQRYASSGTPLGPEFRVNTYTTGGHFSSAVASNASGNFVVVWSGGGDYGVFAQRFASSGAPLGPEFRVNTYTTVGFLSYPSIASDSAGNFVVVWMNDTQDGSSLGVFGQRYSGSGSPLGSEFRVNTYTTYSQSYPSVADIAGNFVVVWQSLGQDGFAGSGVFGQRYSSSGAPLGPEFLVNTYTMGAQARPAITSDATGNFVVVWEDQSQDGFVDGIFGQRYANTGTPLGLEFRVNTYTTNAQTHSDVAADTSGDFVVIWASYTQDGDGQGVFGQRYSQIVPVELLHFRVE